MSILPVHRHPFEGEARRLADEMEIPAHEQGEFIWKACTSMAVRAYHEETAPYVKEKAFQASLFAGDVFITPGGQLVRSPPKYPPEVADLLRQIDEIIASVARKYFLFDTANFGPK